MSDSKRNQMSKAQILEKYPAVKKILFDEPWEKVDPKKPIIKPGESSWEQMRMHFSKVKEQQDE